MIGVVVAADRNYLDGIGNIKHVVPNLPTTTTEHAVIERNVIRSNNLENPFPPPPPFFNNLQLLPSGSGVLNVGGDDVTIRNNVVNHNNTVGIGIGQPVRIRTSRRQPGGG